MNIINIQMETYGEIRDTLGKVAEALSSRGWMLATAESCTGGGIAAACTDLPGSSAWFAGAFVTYSTSWKERFLGVPHDMVERHGVVSEEVVSAMLDGLVARTGVQCAIAVSGIAGPGGAEPGKPVGTVVLGVQAGASREVETLLFQGDRRAVRQATVKTALGKLARMLGKNR